MNDDTKLLLVIGALLLCGLVQSAQLSAVRQTLHVLAFSVWGPDYPEQLQRFVDEHPDYKPLP